MESYFPNVTSNQSQLARERVLEDLYVLAADAETLLTATLGDVSENAGLAREHLQITLARAKATIAELQQKGLASAKAAGKRADAVVRTHPYESLGVALGVGVLVGLILGRK